PGGYLQLAESDMATWRIEKTSPHNKADALDKILKLSQGDDARLRPTWVPNLPTLFRNQGLQDIEVDVKEAPPHVLVSMHECGLLIPELLIRKNIYTTAVKDQMMGPLEEVA
ncbi:UMTA methyltransferase family protein, partial [Aspergillus affinis]|uniref:UMTA methyltransferase family protein n=1 Tax=Aspergillus affinis TaxID=1070780 RepID=UPI0022FF1C75